MASLVTGSKNMKLPKYKFIWELIKNDDINKLIDLKEDNNINHNTNNNNNNKKVVNPNDLGNTQNDLTCATAPGIVFSNIKTLHEHLKSDYHLFNLKRKMKNKKLLTKEKFLAQDFDDDNNNMSSSSSSSEDDDDDNDDNNNNNNNNNNNYGKKSIDFNSISNALLPITYFKFDDNNNNNKCKASLWTCILDDNKNSNVKFNKKTNVMKWIILLYSSNGHFAGAVYENGKLIAHKTFHRYTSRRKQGGSQLAHDNKSGKANSIGAQIRRGNEIELRKDIQNLLIVKWKQHVNEADNIFISTASRNRSVFFKVPIGAKIKTSALEKNEKLKYVPFATARPTLNECEIVKNRLGRIKFSELLLYIKEDQSTVGINDNNNDNNNIIDGSLKKKSNVKHVTKETESTTVVNTIINISKEQQFLYDAIVKNDTNQVKKILNQNPSFVNGIVDTNGSTGLHVAATNGLYDMANLLLHRDADPTIFDNKMNPPFKIVKSKKVRDIFRLYMGKYPKKWNYKKAAMHNAGALTSAKVDAKKRKAKEKKKKARQRKKEQQRAEKKDALNEEIALGLVEHDNKVVKQMTKQDGVENQFEIMERMNDIAVVNGETEDNIMLSMLRLKEIHHCNAGKALDMIENALMNGIPLSQLF